MIRRMQPAGRHAVRAWLVLIWRTDNHEPPYSDMFPDAPHLGLAMTRAGAIVERLTRERAVIEGIAVAGERAFHSCAPTGSMPV